MVAVVQTRIITIETIVHKVSGLRVATSPEMKGLIVHGRSEAELIERIPVAIQAILEADGESVQSVTPIEVAGGLPDDFIETPRRYQAIAA